MSNTYFDPIINEVLIADDGIPDKNGKTAFPDYPEEQPSKSALQSWIDTWTDDIGGIGYAPLLRGEEPFELKKLADRPLIIIPEGTDAGKKTALETENARIDHANKISTAERESRLLEIHVRNLLIEMGLPQTAPTKVYIDNSGAVELSRDRKSCHRSRHIDRRYFKIRELVAEGHLAVEHIDTTLNSADLLTKALAPAPYATHRARILNLPTKGGSMAPRKGGASESPREGGVDESVSK